MVRLAGGEAVLGVAGEMSVRVDWNAVHASRPDLIVCSSCGYPLDESPALAGDVLPELPDVPVGCRRERRVCQALRPRLVDSIEALTEFFHRSKSVRARLVLGALILIL